MKVAIEGQFGSLESLQTKMTAATVAVQGSGWGWLGYDKVSNKLVISACANQDPLEATTGHVPLLGIDVWEHAYYLQVCILLFYCGFKSTLLICALQYKNVRPDYVKNIWKIINWKDVAERLAAAKK